MRPVGVRYEFTTHGTRCYACDHLLGKAIRVETIDGQSVYVGPDCYLKIADAGPVGYQPSLGGPRLRLLGSVAGQGEN